MQETQSLNFIQLNEKYGFTAENSIFRVKQDYNYKIDISHNLVSNLYLDFKMERKISATYPPSDKQRYEFEYIIKRMLDENEYVFRGITDKAYIKEIYQKAKEKQLIPPASKKIS